MLHSIRAVLFVCFFLGAGCGTPNSPVVNAPTPEKEATERVEPAAEDPKPQAPDYEKEWQQLLAQAEMQLSEKQANEAEATLEKLKQVYPAPLSPSDEQARQLAALEQRLAEHKRLLADELRAKKLKEAQELLDQGKLAEATAAVSEVSVNSPTAKQREYIRQLTSEIEQRRKARRDLQAWMQLLASSNRSEVATAQAQLIRHPDVALGLMLESSTAADKPVLVANALEMLRLLERPEAAIPAFLAVLKKSEQRRNWPDAVRQLELIGRPGAGQALLDLALSSTDPEQQMAALTALARVPDLPPNAFVALLSLVERDSVVLVPALQAASHAVRVHEQHDLFARRGIDGNLPADDERRLAELPKRLESLLAAGQAPEVAEAARVLAISTGQLAAAPLSGLKISRVEAETSEGPALAALDGVWNTVDLKNMWRYPPDKRGTILLDLGASKTVSGVRIWNYNEAGGAQRGWKEVEIFVSESPAEPTPAAQGIVPLAPGAAGTPDYGTLVGVPFVKGRYVRLQAKSLWQADGPTGLAEIQVLGF